MVDTSSKRLHLFTAPFVRLMKAKKKILKNETTNQIEKNKQTTLPILSEIFIFLSGLHHDFSTAF